MPKTRHLNDVIHWEIKQCVKRDNLRWLNTIFIGCEYMSFVRALCERGCSLEAETWQKETIVMEDFN